MTFTVRASCWVNPALSSTCVGDIDGLNATGADAADEPLGHDHVDGGCDQEWLDAHVHEAGDGFRGAVGVQRAEHKVSGERGLDGDFGGFKVADFADQDDVGILAQETSAGRRQS